MIKIHFFKPNFHKLLGKHRICKVADYISLTLFLENTRRIQGRAR